MARPGCWTRRYKRPSKTISLEVRMPIRPFIDGDGLAEAEERAIEVFQLVAFLLGRIADEMASSSTPKKGSHDDYI